MHAGQGCMRMYMYTHAHTCTCMHTHTHAHTHTQSHTRTHTCTHTHTHTHTHTNADFPHKAIIRNQFGQCIPGLKVYVIICIQVAVIILTIHK